MSKKSFLQFIKYFLVGILNFLINISVINLLMYSTNVYKNKSLLFSFSIIAFFAYSANGFFMNKKFTFKTKGGIKQYFSYISTMATTGILNAFIFSNLSALKTNFITPSLWANLSLLIASISTGILSFLINKIFIFKRPN